MNIEAVMWGEAHLVIVASHEQQILRQRGYWQVGLDRFFGGLALYSPTDPPG